MSDFTEWDLRKLHVDDNRLEALREAYEHLALHPSDNYKTSGGERVPSDAEHASLFAELQGHRENLCRQCKGQTTIPNPEANYTEDYADGRRTGQYSTNDPWSVT